MNTKADKDQLRVELDRGHFARAAFLAASLDLPEEEIRDLRRQALWQVAAVYRNARGTKRLAQEYGFSKEEVKKTLAEYARERTNRGDDRDLEPCYDHSSGDYLSFEEWMDQLTKKWDKLSG